MDEGAVLRAVVDLLRTELGAEPVEIRRDDDEARPGLYIEADGERRAEAWITLDRGGEVHCRVRFSKEGTGGSVFLAINTDDPRELVAALRRALEMERILGRWAVGAVEYLPTSDVAAADIAPSRDRILAPVLRLVIREENGRLTPALAPHYAFARPRDDEAVEAALSPEAASVDIGDADLPTILAAGAANTINAILPGTASVDGRAVRAGKVIMEFRDDWKIRVKSGDFEFETGAKFFGSVLDALVRAAARAGKTGAESGAAVATGA